MLGFQYVPLIIVTVLAGAVSYVTAALLESIPPAAVALLVIVSGVAIALAARYGFRRSDAREAANTRLEERLITVDEVAAGIAEEINAPVSYIDSNLNGLREDVDALNEFIGALDSASDHLDIRSPFYQVALSAYQRLDIANVCDSAPVRINDCLEGIQRIERIVNDMRVLSNRTATLHTLADINSDLGGVVTLTRSRLPEGAELEVSLLQLSPMLCNPGQIAQVVMHMLTNACHALRGEPGKISLSQKQDAGQLLIQISDTGCGMPEDVRQRAFDPFFTTRAEGEGTGIGLALCYKLIREHGGNIELESEEGSGTCFTLKLPIRQGDENNA